jgi:hypothetical protein
VNGKGGGDGSFCFPAGVVPGGRGECSRALPQPSSRARGAKESARPVLIGISNKLSHIYRRIGQAKKSSFGAQPRSTKIQRHPNGEKGGIIQGGNMAKTDAQTVKHIIEYRRLSNAKAAYLMFIWAISMGFLFPVFQNISGDRNILKLSIYIFIVIASGYIAFGMTFNKIRLAFSTNYLIITHTSIPWTGNKKIVLSNIVDVYYKTAKITTRGGTDTCFQVMARLTDGTTTGLISEDLIYEENKAYELVNSIKNNISCRIPGGPK